MLELRDVPAILFWTNMASDHDAHNAANWLELVGESQWQTTMVGPQIGDSLVFDGNVTSASADGLQGFDLSQSVPDYLVIALINGYSGTVTLAADSTPGLTTEILLLHGGAISQPGEGTDLTVLTNFCWTAGTLNSSCYLAEVMLDGATATIAPASAGTVTLGSHLVLVNEAALTIKDGAVDLNKDSIELATYSASSLLVAPDGPGTVLLGIAQNYLKGEIGPGTTWTVEAEKSVSFRGKLSNLGGTYTLMAGATAEITGSDTSTIAYVQALGAPAATYLYSGSELSTPDHDVVIEIGILATVHHQSHSEDSPKITTDTLIVNGGHIYINHAESTYTHFYFGELLVVGNVLWSGGFFHVCVFCDGTTADVWRTTNPGGDNGRFDIDGGTVVPYFVDSDHGLASIPDAGGTWQILRAGGSFVDNDAPSVSNGWTMTFDTVVPPIFWQLSKN